MKNIFLILLFITISLMLTGCNFIEEQRAKGMVKDYYQAIIDEDYGKAFDQLHLYDYDTKTDDSKLSEGTTSSDEEAKGFYLEKIEVLKEQNYELKDFEIDEEEYSDGHTFWYHIKLQVEQNGQEFEWSEVAEIYGNKLLIGGSDDQYVKYRDGKMNFNIEKELKEIECNRSETEKGDFIIGKRIHNRNPQILVAIDMTREDVETKSPSDFINEEVDLMWYTLEDKDLYENLNVEEKVTVKIETFKEDGANVYFVSQPYPPQAKASEVIRCDN